MEIHRPGEEVKKLPEDPKKIRAIITGRAKALLAKLVQKIKK